MRAAHVLPAHLKTKGQTKITDPHHLNDLERFSKLSVRTQNVRGPSETKHLTVRARTLVGQAPIPEVPIASPMSHVPSPPSSARPRPSSASKFRKMVIECRDGS